jgi:hypothetical protein
MYLATEEIFSIFVKGLQNVQRESGHVIRKKRNTVVSWINGPGCAS